jgi:hypothetical protein
VTEPSQDTAPAYRCQVCHGDGVWRIDRRGDAVVSWACREHLSAVCDLLQRHWEVSELVVVLAAKIREWSSIGATLDQIAEGKAHFFDRLGPRVKPDSRAACGAEDDRRVVDYLELVECAECRVVVARRAFGGSQ